MAISLPALEMIRQKTLVDYSTLRCDRRLSSQIEKDAADHVARLKTINLIVSALIDQMSDAQEDDREKAAA